jgi:hypothetical protein
MTTVDNDALRSGAHREGLLARHPPRRGAHPRETISKDGVVSSSKPHRTNDRRSKGASRYARYSPSPFLLWRSSRQDVAAVIPTPLRRPSLARRRRPPRLRSLRSKRVKVISPAWSISAGAAKCIWSAAAPALPLSYSSQGAGTAPKHGASRSTHQSRRCCPRSPKTTGYAPTTVPGLFS